MERLSPTVSAIFSLALDFRNRVDDLLTVPQVVPDFPVCATLNQTALKVC